MIDEVLDAIGIARVGAADHEADDVIGTLTGRAGGPVDIVTGDRDLFQLVDDERGVRVLYPVKGVGTLQLVDESYVREKYGVDGRGYVDLALLRGDPSDGLPGVPGVGEKTAAKLLAAHGDLAGIMAAVDDPAAKLTPTQRKRLAEARPYIESPRRWCGSPRMWRCRPSTRHCRARRATPQPWRRLRNGGDWADLCADCCPLSRDELLS